MTSLRNLLLAAIKQLLRGRSILSAVFTFWIRPQGAGDVKSATVGIRQGSPPRAVQDFIKEAHSLLIEPLDKDGLRRLSSGLKSQFTIGLRSNPSCMLPSFNHALPSGMEKGEYLALDVGGSNLRVAVVELRGRDVAELDRRRITCMRSFKIGPHIKQLEGRAFFDWMAERILETISSDINREHSSKNPLPMSMAWSFPVEQTSLKGGLLQSMGKSFKAADALVGEDLGEVIETACKKINLHVELAAIINDSTACLLSEAYLKTSTRFGLILGTGVNLAGYLPLALIGEEKFKNRPQSWFDEASHLIVNSELGMFGRDLLPCTRWDQSLKLGHPRPDFQPLEYLVSGQYLGEVCRFALIEAITTVGLFGGVVPPSLLQPYALDTETVAVIEGASDVTKQIEYFKSRHPCLADPTSADMAALRAISSRVARRSSAIVAAAIVALWELKTEAEGECKDAHDESSTFFKRFSKERDLDSVVVAFNGSVIEQYPGYRSNCQRYIDDLLGKEGIVSLVEAKESSLLGAAVSLACLENA